MAAPTGTGGRLRGTARRAGWNLADQVVSSATNAVLSFLVARSVDETQFGGFAVAFTIFSLALGVSRALSTSPLGVRFSDAVPDEFRVAAGSAVGTAFVLGVVGGLGCLVVAGPIGGAAGTALAALGVVLPGLLTQDAWRYVFFASARPAAAALNDVVWAVVQIGAVLALLSGGVASVAPLVVAWGASAVVAAVVGAGQAGLCPRPGRAAGWWRRHRSLTGYLVGEYVTVQGGQQGALLVIATVGSLQEVGSLRGVQVLLGPTTILAVAALSFAVPEFSRRRDRFTPAGWARAAAAVSGVVTLLGLGWGVLFLLAPDVVGRTLLGPTWPGVDAVLWPTVVAQVGGALGLGPSIMLIAMARTRTTFVLSVITAPLLLVGGVGGVLLDGARGASWGFALAFWIVLPLDWLLMLRQARRLPAPAAD